MIYNNNNNNNNNKLNPLMKEKKDYKNRENY